MSRLIDFIITIPILIFSLTLHEIAHGVAAMTMGDKTARASGRLSFNPLKHFNPVGLMMLLFVRFGYANPVPINPNNFRNRKVGLFTVSIAGVALNLILSFLCFPLLLLCAKSDTILSIYLGYFFYWMVMININLALFNLLPIFPLDGFRIIESCTRAINPVTRFLRNYGQYILIALVGVSILVDNLNMPYYFDVLGLYISNVGDFILDGFYKFWSLVF